MKCAYRLFTIYKPYISLSVLESDDCKSSLYFIPWCLGFEGLIIGFIYSS